MRHSFIAFGLAMLLAVSGGIAEAKKQDKPVALVLSIENAPDAEVVAYQHVFDGDRIDLRPGGVLKVSYLNTCEEEVITGGRVKFRETDRKLSKGAKAETTEALCLSADQYRTEEEEDIYEDVQALSPFQDDRWREKVIKSTIPIFQWPMGTQTGQVMVKVTHLDASPEILVYEVASSANYLIYPSDAPPLETGEPYRVDVAYPDGSTRSTIFSCDPDLGVPDNVTNRLVPMEW